MPVWGREALEEGQRTHLKAQKIWKAQCNIDWVELPTPVLAQLFLHGLRMQGKVRPAINTSDDSEVNVRQKKALGTQTHLLKQG